MLTLALLKPDRADLKLLKNFTSPSPTTLNRSNNTLTASRSQHADLLIEGFDSLEKKTQITVLPELGRFLSPKILSKLMDLEKQDDSDMRAAALLALGKNGTSKARSRLQAVAKDPREAISVRIRAIHALGYSRSESVVEFLTKLIEQEPSLANAIYASLDRLASPQVLPFLKRSLAQQDERHRQWRKFRSTWKENSASFISRFTLFKYVSKLVALIANYVLD
jgi:HEAT repeat protein